MIIAIDVDYRGDKANTSGIVFKNWHDNESFAEYTIRLDNIKEYIPGQFYKRELPCLTKILSIVNEDITAIVIDGFVWLSDIYKKGLGAFLYQKLNKTIPVIGVAKKSFYSLGQNHRVIYRGNSKSALFITSAGIDLDLAAKHIIEMSGEHRIPKLLKLADSVCRQWD